MKQLNELVKKRLNNEWDSKGSCWPSWWSRRRSSSASFCGMVGLWWCDRY